MQDAPAPLAPQAPQQPVQQVQQIPHLNWSHFKLEFLENQNHAC